jgi:hypothetical protein
MPPIYFGALVGIAPGSPLKRVIGFTNELILAHDQNSFSFEFSALSFRVQAIRELLRERPRAAAEPLDVALPIGDEAIAE